MEVLPMFANEEVNFSEDTFFTAAQCCLPIRHPRCLLPVRHQRRANACCPLAVVGCLFTDLFISRGLRNLGSAQELVDCVHLEFPTRASILDELGKRTPPEEGYGMDYFSAFQYIVTFRGICLHSIYRWTGVCVKCKRAKYADKLVGIRKFTSLDTVEEVREKLDEDKIVIGSIISTELLHEWTGDGIYSHDERSVKKLNGVPVGHAITLFGFGGEGGKEYFLAQNTWGVRWGHKGYFKVDTKSVYEFYFVDGTRVKVVRRKPTNMLKLMQGNRLKKFLKKKSRKKHRKEQMKQKKLKRGWF